MAQVITQDSAFAKEMAKWEAYPSVYSPQAGRPYNPNARWPAMFYRVGHKNGGALEILERREAADEVEGRNLYSRGFGNGVQEAIDLFEQQQTEIATLAANRAHSDQRMSEKARGEAAAKDAETLEHLPVIPETPIRRRPGRKPKTVTTE